MGGGDLLLAGEEHEDVAWGLSEVELQDAVYGGSKVVGDWFEGVIQVDRERPPLNRYMLHNCNHIPHQNQKS